MDNNSMTNEFTYAAITPDVRYQSLYGHYVETTQVNELTPDIVNRYLALLGGHDAPIEAILASQAASVTEKAKKAAKLNAWFQDKEQEQAKIELDLAEWYRQQSMRRSAAIASRGQQWPGDLLLSHKSGMSISEGRRPSHKSEHKPTGRSSPASDNGERVQGSVDEGKGGNARQPRVPNEPVANRQGPSDQAAEEGEPDATDVVPGIGEAGPGPRTRLALKRKRDEALKAKALSPKRRRASRKATVDADGMVIRKREANSEIPERKPKAEDFVEPGKWVAVYCEVNPIELHDKVIVWEEDPLFKTVFRPLLKAIQWNDTDFQVPASNNSCPYSSQGANGDTSSCTTPNKGHHARHMLIHLPEGIGYWIMCPNCKAVSRRSDNYARHVKGRRCGAKDTEIFEEAYYDNCFLRLPSTPYLEKLARAQRKDPNLQFWLPGDVWDESLVRENRRRPRRKRDEREDDADDADLTE